MSDVVIIGSGAAGLTAALYTARARLATTVIGRLEGSRAIQAHKIDNYLGFPDGIAGDELIRNGLAQVRRFNVEIVEGEVTGVRQEENLVVHTADGRTFEGVAVIFATGAARKSSGIQGEDDFVGRGVSYCVACDAFFFKDQKLAVIGNGAFAAREALELVPFSKDITLFANAANFDLSDELQTELRSAGIPLRAEKVTALQGGDQLEALALESGETFPVSGVFIALGTAGSADFARTLGLEIDGNSIVIDREGKTNYPGVFAAGDCTGGYLQVSKAVGEGCSAGMSAVSYVREAKKGR
jgi:thioredoxin reductase (NADPH)